jgi:hypothetical protein
VGALIYWDPLRVASAESTQSEENPVSRGVLSVTTVAADTFVVDIAPEIAVVLGVGDRDLLGRLSDGVPGQIQLTGVDVEQLDVVEDSLDVVDHPAHRRRVVVPGPQRCHAPPQPTDELVKFGEFSSAGQRISLTDKGVMDHITAPDNIHHTTVA